jgi:Na+/melibiose symporter-like transporter
VLFYVADVLQTPAASGPLLALYFVAGVISLPVWVGLARRYGRLRPWLAAMLLAVAGFVATPFLGAGAIAAFAIVCGVSGFALGADLALPAALLADLAEQRSRAAGGARAGAYLGWWNLVAKLNLALAAGLALPLLDAVGYRPGQPAAATALAWAYGGLPLVFKLLAVLLVWRWRHILEKR